MTDNLTTGDGVEGTEGPSYGEWLEVSCFCWGGGRDVNLECSP